MHRCGMFVQCMQKSFFAYFSSSTSIFLSYPPYQRCFTTELRKIQLIFVLLLKMATPNVEDFCRRKAAQLFPAFLWKHGCTNAMMHGYFKVGNVSCPILHFLCVKPASLLYPQCPYCFLAISRHQSDKHAHCSQQFLRNL